MSKEIRWLYAESERWVREGILSAEQAARLRALYPAPTPTRPWATLIFCGLGAVIVGLGVILLFAYNWHAMPKIAKLVTVFAALAAAHAGGLYLFQAKPRYRAMGEALTVAGTMLFGAGIWLVAQIYHIDEHFPTGFLIWGLGAFLLAWTLPSIFQALVALALLTIWAGTESTAFSTPVHRLPAGRGGGVARFHLGRVYGWRSALPGIAGLQRPGHGGGLAARGGAPVP
jgi:uncharacterized membrane protein